MDEIIGTFARGRRSAIVQTFTFIVSDLADFEAEPITMGFESDEKAVKYGSLFAREMLEQMPDISGRGICVTVYDDGGTRIAIVPVDPVH